MKYILVMISTESAWKDMTSEQMQVFDDRETAFNEDLRSSGAWVSGAGLRERSTAKTVRFDSGTPIVTDGPHSDAAEQMIGFWIIEAASVEQAVEWGKRAPMDGGAIEVRPTVWRLSPLREGPTSDVSSRARL